MPIQQLIKDGIISRKQAAAHEGAEYTGDIPLWQERDALEIITALQTTLDVATLIELFASKAEEYLQQTGLTYTNQQLDLDLQHGKQGRHRCSYRLSLTDNELGQIEFSRNRRFSDPEIILAENLLTALLYPLRNALMYQQTLNSALQDPLTGIGNRSSFDKTLQREVSLARRHETPLALIVLDIDHFKGINDRFGHLIGDCVLKDVAECTSSCIRNSDMLFRYGGEEFVVLLSNTDLEGAKLLAERIRHTIERLCSRYGHAPLGVTVSLGVTSLRPDESGEEVFDRADRALYVAKDNGRNQVISN